jgi:hypothetical protein
LAWCLAIQLTTGLAILAGFSAFSLVQFIYFVQRQGENFEFAFGVGYPKKSIMPLRA